MPHIIFHQAVDFQRLMEGRLVSSLGRQTSSADKFEGEKKPREAAAEKTTAHQHQMVYMLSTS